MKTTLTNNRIIAFLWSADRQGVRAKVLYHTGKNGFNAAAAITIIYSLYWPSPLMCIRICVIQLSSACDNDWLNSRLIHLICDNYVEQGKKKSPCQAGMYEKKTQRSLECRRGLPTTSSWVGSDYVTVTVSSASWVCEWNYGRSKICSVSAWSAHQTVPVHGCNL